MATTHDDMTYSRPGTRAEHMAWAKERALAYLNLPEPDPRGAICSLLSDLEKHAETRQHFGRELGALLLIGGHLNTVQQAREFIEGFN